MQPTKIAKLALFLRQTPGLNKAALGDFLGANNDVGKATLTAMVALFDFRALTVDQALRVFLEAFRLPGEAQQIDRIVQVCSCVIAVVCLYVCLSVCLHGARLWPVFVFTILFALLFYHQTVTEGI